MTTLLYFDLEATGVDPLTAEIIEIGYVFGDFEAGAIHQQIGSLVQLDGDIPAEIIELTGGAGGITKAHTNEHGLPIEQAMAALTRAMVKADVIAAHNLFGYDKPLFERVCKDAGIGEMFPGKWFDSQTDIDYPATMGRRGLVNLAAMNGLINTAPHRALPDSLLGWSLMQKFKPLDIKAIAADELIIVAATNVNPRQRDTFEANKEIVKQNGFIWQGLVPKKWAKRIRKGSLDCLIKKVSPVELEIL